MTKICNKCKKESSIDNYTYNANAKDKKHSWCNDCQRLDNRMRSRNRAPAKRYALDRKAKLKQKYGMSLAAFNMAFISQMGVCKICVQKSPSKSLCVDHDHITNKVRGLLCNSCNTGLGYFKDNPIFLQRAIEYLKDTDPLINQLIDKFKNYKDEK